MSKVVLLPDRNMRLVFPDSMTEEEITAVIREKMYREPPSPVERIKEKVADVAATATEKIKPVLEQEYEPPAERPERRPHERSSQAYEGGRPRSEAQEAFAQAMQRGLGKEPKPYEGELAPSTKAGEVAGSVAGSLMGYAPWIAGAGVATGPVRFAPGLATSKAGQLAWQATRGAATLGAAEGARQTVSGEQSPEQIATSAAIGAVIDPLFSQAVEWLIRRFGPNWRNVGPQGAEMPLDDAYRTLGLERNATPEQVRGAWRHAARQHHPDAGGDPAMFRKFASAYERIQRTFMTGPKATPTTPQPKPSPQPYTPATQPPAPMGRGMTTPATPPVPKPTGTPISTPAPVEMPAPVESSAPPPPEPASEGVVAPEPTGRGMGATRPRVTKPRMAENADDLYRAVIEMSEKGKVTSDGHVLYPTVKVFGVGDFTYRDGKWLKLQAGGTATSEPTPEEIADLHHAFDTDTAQVVLLSRWGGSGNVEARARKVVEELHSPSGFAFEKSKPSTQPTPVPPETPTPMGRGLGAAQPPEEPPKTTPQGKAPPLEDVVHFKMPGSGLPESLRNARDLAVRAFSVTKQFDDIGAPKTGRTLERVYTTQELNVTQQEDELAKPFTKLKRELDIPDEKVKDLLFYAYDNTEFMKLPEAERAKLEPLVQQMRDYSKRMEARQKEHGVFEEGFEENLIPRLQDEIWDIKDEIAQSKSRAKITRLAGKLQEAQESLEWAKARQGELTYMPTPYRYWFNEIIKSRGPTRAVSIMSRHWRKKTKLDMRALADELLDKGIITEDQLDPRRIFADYARNAGIKMAMADVFKAAKEEGLIVSALSKDAPSGWVAMPQGMMPALGAGRHPYLMHPRLYDYVSKNLMVQGKVDPEAREVVRGLRHVWTGIKMFQFDNPLILGSYDVLQGFVLGSMRSVKTPSYLVHGIKSAWTHDKDYMEAFEHGAMPRPWHLPSDEAMKRAERVIESEKPLKRVVAEMKRFAGSGFLPELYRLSHMTAWALDHSVRMASYHYLRDKGYDPEDAAELVVNAHGRYSNVPPATRRKLNIPLFTPTFWISMAKEQGKMVTGLLKTVSGKGDIKSKKYAEMAVAALATLIGTDLFLTQMGFERQSFARRYVMRAEVDRQVHERSVKQDREIVVTLSTPYNIFLRWWDNLKRIPETAGWADKGTRLVPISIHPGFWIIKELLSNETAGMEPIWNPYDVPQDKAKDILIYLTNRVFRMTERFGETPVGERRTEAVRALKQEIGNVAHVLNYIAFVYDRAPKEIRSSWQIKRMEQELRRQVQFNEDAPPEKVDVWIQNLQEKVQGIMDNLQK